MTYMKSGGLIRLVADNDVARFAAQGFSPMVKSLPKGAKKPVRKVKEVKAHGGA